MNMAFSRKYIAIAFLNVILFCLLYRTYRHLVFQEKRLNVLVERETVVSFTVHEEEVAQLKKRTSKPTTTTVTADAGNNDEEIRASREFKMRLAEIKRREMFMSESRLTTTTTAPSLEKPANCSLLFGHNALEIKRARLLLKAKPYVPPTAAFFINITQDCERFKRRMGYNKPVSKKEEGFPIAYGLRMHTSVAQAERLLRAIYMRQNVYCIHVDKNSSDEIYRAMEKIAGCFENVFMASKRYEYHYAGFSPVEVDLQCMQDTLNTKVAWKYYLNIAGQEYPLKSNLELVTLLEFMNGTNDIEQYKLPPLYRWRVESVCFFSGGKSVRTAERKKPFVGRKNLQIYKGTAYNSFSRKFVEWVFTSKFAREFIAWTNGTYSPDEIVWATLNVQPDAPGGYPVEIAGVGKTHLSREVVWLWSNQRCAGMYVRQICILTVDNLEWLKVRWEFFANKFYLDYDHIVLDCLDEMLKERQVKPEINWEIMNSHFPHLLYVRDKWKKKTKQ